MKILLINTLYYPNIVGGAERSVQILAESLVSKGNDVVVLSINNKKGINSNIINGVKVYYISLKNIYFPFQECKNEVFRLCWHLIDIYNPIMAHQISKIIHLELPDIIHTNNLSGFSVSAWPVSKKYQIPLIHTIRDYYLPCYLTSMYKKGKNCINQCVPCKFFCIIKKQKSNLPDTVVGISRYILDKHINLGFFSNVKNRKIINNSLFYSKDPVNVTLKNDFLRFGFLGKIEEKKGIELLLNTFSKMQTNKAQLLIGGIGKNKYYKNLKKKYYLKENIKFLGFVNPYNFLKDIDILVVPSLWNEPFGRTIVEAYQQGIPVIGTIRGGIPEIIETEETGYLFDPDLPDDLFKIMKKIINDPYFMYQMKTKCFRKSEFFLTDIVSNFYINEYKKII